MEMYLRTSDETSDNILRCSTPSAAAAAAVAQGFESPSKGFAQSALERVRSSQLILTKSLSRAMITRTVTGSTQLTDSVSNSMLTGLNSMANTDHALKPTLAEVKTKNNNKTPFPACRPVHLEAKVIFLLILSQHQPHSQSCRAPHSAQRLDVSHPATVVSSTW
jgi:hypothetical protein